MTPKRSRIALIVGLAAMAALVVALGVLRGDDAPPYPAIPALEDLDPPPVATSEPLRTPRVARLPNTAPRTLPAGESVDPPATPGPRLEDHLNPVAAPHAERSTPQTPAQDTSTNTPAVTIRPGDDPDLAAALADPTNPNRWVTLADRFRVQRHHDLEAAALRRAIRATREPHIADMLLKRVRQAEDDAGNTPGRPSSIEFPGPSNP